MCACFARTERWRGAMRAGAGARCRGESRGIDQLETSDVRLLRPYGAMVCPVCQSSGSRYRPVWDSATAATCSGVPATTSAPPPTPASGPMSMM